MIHLLGMAFDHPRGFAPMRATSEKFQVSNPDLRISWDARSLKDFEDYPIEKLAEKYDLIMMDHPFIGSGVKQSARPTRRTCTREIPRGPSKAQRRA